MAYFITLLRTEAVSNKQGLERNKSLATDLVKNFQNLQPPNELANLIVDNDSDYPECHFQLDFENDETAFLINFWRHQIIFEMSGSHEPKGLFKQVKLMVSVILDYGYVIDDPVEDKIYNLEEGMQRHFEEFIGHTQQVAIVRKI